VSGQGEYKDHQHGNVHELKPGSIFLRTPEITHTTTISNAGGEAWIEAFVNVGPKLAHALELCGTIQLEPPCQFLGPSEQWLDEFVKINQLSFHLSENQVQNFMLRCCSLLEKIFTALRTAQAGNDEQMIQTACLELSKSLKAPLNLKSLCENHSWDYDYFRKKFKKYLGISPAQYRINRRIDSAKEILITHPKIILADCAEQLGYSSVYEFCNQFKKVTGSPPGHFKRG
jgi:AraC family transcriptional regulator, arabinose operon regulatory protein